MDDLDSFMRVNMPEQIICFLPCSTDSQFGELTLSVTLKFMIYSMSLNCSCFGVLVVDLSTAAMDVLLQNNEDRFFIRTSLRV